MEPVFENTSTDAKRKDITGDDNSESSKKSKLESTSGSSSSNDPVSTAFLDDMNAEYECESVVIKCKNNVEVSVPVSQALQSGLIKDMLEMGFANQVIPLHDLPVSSLQMIMEYWKVHAESAGCDEERSKDIQQWKTDFFTRIGPDDMFDLLETANYLDSPELLHKGADFVAEEIKKMNVDQIRAHFGMKYDFTPEEEEELKKEFPWANEDIC